MAVYSFRCQYVPVSLSTAFLPVTLHCHWTHSHGSPWCRRVRVSRCGRSGPSYRDILYRVVRSWVFLSVSLISSEHHALLFFLLLLFFFFSLILLWFRCRRSLTNNVQVTIHLRPVFINLDLVRPGAVKTVFIDYEAATTFCKRLGPN